MIRNTLDLPETWQSQNVEHLQLPLEFDACATHALRSTIDDLADQNTNDLVIDMSAVDFMDSSGIGAIVFLFKRLTAQSRKMVLYHPKGQPAEMLRLIGVDRAIETLRTPTPNTTEATS